MKVKFSLRVDSSESLKEVLEALRETSDRNRVDMEVELRLDQGFRTSMEVINGSTEEITVKRNTEELDDEPGPIGHVLCKYREKMEEAYKAKEEEYKQSN